MDRHDLFNCELPSRDAETAPMLRLTAVSDTQVHSRAATPQRRQRAHAPCLIWGRVRCVYSERSISSCERSQEVKCDCHKNGVLVGLRWYARAAAAAARRAALGRFGSFCMDACVGPLHTSSRAICACYLVGRLRALWRYHPPVADQLSEPHVPSVANRLDGRTQLST